MPSAPDPGTLPPPPTLPVEWRNRATHKNITPSNQNLVRRALREQRKRANLESVGLEALETEDGQVITWVFNERPSAAGRFVRWLVRVLLIIVGAVGLGSALFWLYREWWMRGVAERWYEKL